MNKLVLAVALAGLVAGPALAQQSTAPGQRMQEQGSVKGTTGASGYSPGHEMQSRRHGKLMIKGASRFAPGHAKTTVGMSRGDREGLSTKSKTSTTQTTTGTKSTTGVSKY